LHRLDEHKGHQHSRGKFFAKLMKELLIDADFAIRDVACRQLLHSSNCGTTGRRRHSKLGYRTPVEFEAVLAS